MLPRVLPVFGAIVVAFALTLLVPLLVSLAMGDGAHAAFWPVLVGGLALGLLLLRPLGRGSAWPDLGIREGILLVNLCWMLLPALACLPLLLYFESAGRPLSLTDAYFEAVSGLTTTGATVLVGLDALPGSINLWRCFLQWQGGMGILVLAVAILPMVGAGGHQLFRVEVTGPMKDTRLTPRITETAKGLWSVYCGLSLLCVLAYWLGGMSALDAWIHMFSTMSLGGLSSHDNSFGWFASPTLEWIAIVFMLLASGNFALYFLAFLRRSPLPFWRDAEWRASMALLLAGGCGVAALLLVRGIEADPGDALRTALFNVVSIGSTTGYATVDYTQWPVFAPLLMLMLSGVATSAGSTGAGIKMARALILLKQTRREMARLIHPRVVNPVRVGGHVVESQTILTVLAFMLVYGATLIGLTFLLLLSDMPFDTAFSAIVACVNNMGPGLGEVGPAGNYGGLNDFQKWVCTLAMVMGRLEMLSFLMLFTRGFWRK